MFEPHPAAAPPAFRQGEMWGATDACVEPSSGVAEALTDVVGTFLEGGRLAQFAASVGRGFGLEQRGPGVAAGVSKARPCEVKDLVDCD
jgi:hypothetical protein